MTNKLKEWFQKHVKPYEKGTSTASEDAEAGAVPNQWGLLNRTLLVYKAAAGGLSLLSMLLVCLAFYLASSDPIVVLEKCQDKVFIESSREPLKLTDDDIRRFISQWVKLRYTWKWSDMPAVLRAIEPVSTEGFRERIKDYLGKKQGQPGAKDQQVEESVANIEVTVTEKDATASFDRIVRINSIPIVIPSQVSLQIVQGRTNKWNPLGLYVNGIIEHEDK